MAYKNLKISTLFYSAVACLLCSNILAQSNQQAVNFREIALRMKKQYAQASKMHIQMAVSVFEDAVKEPFYQLTAAVKKDGENYFYHIDQQEILMNEKFMIVVDHSVKEIYCSRRNARTLQDPVQVSLDSLLSIYGDPSFVGEANGSDHFRLMLKNGFISQIDLHIDKLRSVFSKVEYHYETDHYAVIDFKIFDSQPVFEPEIFDERRFITVGNGKYETSPSFRGYKVVNQDAIE
jgi:outer membrane lipoprotein-sorting protein